MKQFSEEIRDVVTSRIFKTKINRIFCVRAKRGRFSTVLFRGLKLPHFLHHQLLITDAEALPFFISRNSGSLSRVTVIAEVLLVRS